eukprot:3934987-Rhodomonas_salina.1
MRVPGGTTQDTREADSQMRAALNRPGALLEAGRAGLGLGETMSSYARRERWLAKVPTKRSPSASSN